MNRIARIALALVACMALGLPGTASAAGCRPGTAAKASAEHPHLVDPGTDTSTGVWPGGDAAYDITRVWVSQKNDPPVGQPAAFAVNLAVPGLDQHPVGAAYYVNYAASEWVAAKAQPDGTWRFSWGVHPVTAPVIGNAFQDSGSVAGTVDTAEDLISITLPGERLPGPRKDGREVLLDRLTIATGTALGAPGTGQPELINYADTSNNAESCAVVLYAPPTES